MSRRTELNQALRAAIAHGEVGEQNALEAELRSQDEKLADRVAELMDDGLDEADARKQAAAEGW